MSSDVNELGAIARGAEAAMVAYIAENVTAKDPTNPSPEESNAIVTCLMLSISLAEARLKAYLPEEFRHNTRAFFDQFSAVVGKLLSGGESPPSIIIKE